MGYECRICGAALSQVFADLGVQPPSNAYLTREQLVGSEVFYPLTAYVCSKCALVQLPEHASAESIFGGEYLYFSSYSAAWLEHARRYVDMIVDNEKLDEKSFVVELASNDGYMLQYFMEKRIPVLGVEPAPNVAKIANEKGVPTLCKFFGAETAREIVESNGQADLICGANVLAHVPRLHDFIEGMRILLKPRGLITMEFPWLCHLIDKCQFDTIYHEHFSYLSLHALDRAFAEHDLLIRTAQHLDTHGGSLRIYVGHRLHSTSISADVDLVELAMVERESGLTDPRSEKYLTFQSRAERTKNKLLSFLLNSKALGLKGAGFGAPAKANTFLNFAGVKPDLLPLVVDDNPHKQGRYMPGSRIPIGDSLSLATIPNLNWVLVMPWNLFDSLEPKVRKLVSPTTRIINPVSLGT